LRPTSASQPPLATTGQIACVVFHEFDEGNGASLGAICDISAAILSQSHWRQLQPYPRSGAVAGFADRPLWLWIKRECLQTLWEELKIVRNERRLKFLSDFASLCQVEGPPLPPRSRVAELGRDARVRHESDISAAAVACVREAGLRPRLLVVMA
jgi:hypothetical protein